MLPAAEAVAPLVDSLGDPSWRVRKAAVERLTALEDVSGPVRALVPALADGENPGRRNAALEALMRFGAAAVPVLLEASHDADVDVRKQAVDALAAIGAPAAAQRLAELLGDPDANVRAAAADALGAIGAHAGRRAARSARRRGPGAARAASRRCARSPGSRSRFPWRSSRRALADPLLRPSAYPCSASATIPARSTRC